MAAATARVPGAAEAEAAAAARRGTFEGEAEGVAPLESVAVALGEREAAPVPEALGVCALGEAAAGEAEAGAWASVARGAAAEAEAAAGEAAAAVAEAEAVVEAVPLGGVAVAPLPGLLADGVGEADAATVLFAGVPVGEGDTSFAGLLAVGVGDAVAGATGSAGRGHALM